MPTRFDPHESADEFWACHRLLFALMPPHRLRALLTVAGSPTAALALSREALVSDPELALTERQAERLHDAAREEIPNELARRVADLGIWAIRQGDPTYPRHLMPFPDSPPLLFVRGELNAEDGDAVAIVGSRRATRYGADQAVRFAAAFAAHSLTVVSGGASGIDTAAHRGALDAGGRTLAVLGCGVDIVYPAENRALFDEIAARGALLSEFALGTRPEPWHFPTRNRIIAGIGRATLVIETPNGSGALITARNAADYGRDVWAVPGTIGAGDRSRGCHRLIQDGAGLADAPEDILRELGIAVAEDEGGNEKPARFSRSKSPSTRDAAPATSHEPPIPDHVRKPAPAGQEGPKAPSADAAPSPIPGLSDSEQNLLSRFGADPRHVDEANQEAGLSAAEAAVALTLLEMKGLLRRQPGNLYVRPR